PAALSIADVTGLEGDQGAHKFFFAVQLSNPSDQRVAVTYSTSDGTATAADHDYAATTGQLTFEPGVMSQSFSVIVNSDTKAEPDQNFFVTLSGAINAAIRDDHAEGVIFNDDGSHALRISDASATEGGALGFTVTLATRSSKI